VIAVVDYGASNVQSVLRALRAVGAEAVLSTDPAVVRAAERVVVPGVGHFAPAMRALTETGLGDAVRETVRAGTPTLGICLGLQLFLEQSEEAPGVAGLGLLQGGVMRFRTSLPVPHVGWARVELTERGRMQPVLAGAFTVPEAYFYHVHSFHPDVASSGAALGRAEYGAAFPTILGCDNVLGVQFHPEKSQGAGLALLEAFARWTP
jgi:imidazole glycerol phosphate synthase glutamine amidotransferase subunit